MYDYNYDMYASSTSGGVLAALGVFLGVVILISIAILVLQIIGYWKILVKGGKPGWGSLIPIYNQYLLCDMVGVSPWWILIVICGSILTVIPVIGSLLSLAVSVYFTVLLNVSLARSFDKKDSYAVGLILLAPIFYLMLGCGSSVYQGKKPMDDVIMDAINKNKNTNSNSNDVNMTNIDNSVNSMNTSESTQATNAKFCTSCGNKLNNDDKFCTSCGTEVK